MKSILCPLLLLLAAVTLPGACDTFEDDDDMDTPPYADASATTLFTGQWELRSATGEPTPPNVGSSQTGEAPAVSLTLADGRLSVSRLPADLLTALALQRTPDEVQAPVCTATLREKGYSQSATIFAVDMPDYTFNVRCGTDAHQLRVTFAPDGELGLDRYLGTLSLFVTMTAIYVDGQPAGLAPTGLYLHAEQR